MRKKIYFYATLFFVNSIVLVGSFIYALGCLESDQAPLWWGITVILSAGVMIFAFCNIWRIWLYTPTFDFIPPQPPQKGRRQKIPNKNRNASSLFFLKYFVVAVTISDITNISLN